MMNHLVSTRTSLIRATNLLLGSRISAKHLLPCAKQTFYTSGLKLSSSTGDSDGSTSNFRPSEDLLKERYDSRASEEPDRKRARLLYQSRKRGMLENGVILASFADKFLHEFNDEQLDQYDRLINLPTNDWDIFYWATKTKPTPPEFETPVMQKLREHLKSKVSKQNDDNGQNGYQKVRSSSIYQKKPDDIAMPASKKNYPLDIDPSEVSLTNYKEELFDDRVRAFKSNVYVKHMTQWRKNLFLKRIKRTIPAPISLRNLSDEKVANIYTQKSKDSNIGKDLPPKTDLIDTKYDRTMKHHNFVQHLLSSEFTDNASMYDDEAEAWSDAMWHRNYGTEDSDIAPSSITCSSCSSKLHCCDPGLTGYVPKELFAKLIHGDNELAKCQRCTFSHQYNLCLSTDVEENLFIDLLRQLRATKPSVVCLLVDLTDFPSGIWENIIDLIGIHHSIIIAGNKLDLLPYDGPKIVERVTYSLKKNLSKLRPGQRNLYIQDMVVLSARTGFGVEALVSKLLTMASTRPNTDIYLVGGSHSGKSTLFNALLQSDLSHLRKGDLIGRISTFQLPSSNILRMLRFPVANLEEWELVLKQRRTEIVQRNYQAYEQSLGSTTKCRQASQPHLSMLINRIDHEPIVQSVPPSYRSENNLEQVDDLITREKNEEVPKLSHDHPFQKLDKPREPLSARPEEFTEHGIFHLLPSAPNKDQLHDILTNNEKLEVFPHETIIPRKYSLRPLQSIFIAGLARLDLLTAQSNVIFTIFASKYLPIHVIQTRKADQFYCKFLGSPYLGVPFGDERRLEDWPGLEPAGRDIQIKSKELHYGVDIVLSSVGWALVKPSIDQECLVRAYTPQARGIHERWPPLLACTGAVMRRGRKIRDTPLFQHPHYQIQQVSADW